MGPVVAIDCRCVKGSCVALRVEVGLQCDLNGHRSCTLKGCSQVLRIAEVLGLLSVRVPQGE